MSFHPFTRLGGLRPELARTSPRDRMLAAGLGSMMLVTACVGAAGMFVLAQMIFSMPWEWALVPALIWAVCIVIIDRALTITFPTTVSKRVFWPILGRFALALVIGVVVATPITLQIFKSEIDIEIATLQSQLREELNADNVADPQVARIPELEEKVEAARQAIDDGTAAARTNPAYLAAVAAAKAAYDDWSVKNDAWNAEAQGTGGTGLRGVGPVAEQLRIGVEQAWQAYEEKRAAAEAALADALAAAETTVAEAKEALPELQAELTDARAREAVLTDQNEARVVAAGGLHNRVAALFALAATSPSGLFVHIAVFLFFLVIEMMPVLVKLMMVSRPPTEEAQALALADATLVVHADEARKRAVADEEADTTIALAGTRARLAIGEDAAQRRESRGLWENAERDRIERDAAESRLAREGEQARESAAAAHIDGAAWEADEPTVVSESFGVEGDLLTETSVVGGRYRLVSQYQSGSPAVWKAVDLLVHDAPPVAVKLLPGPSVDDDPRVAKAAEAEIETVRRLPEHENVMRVVGAGFHHESNHWWYASPWYGDNLKAHLATAYQSADLRQRPQLVEIAEYVRDAARGLAAAHALGIAHGDMKPTNLVFDQDTRGLRVIDFGLARTAAALSSARSGMPRGTPYYSAPELSVRGEGGSSPMLADVFGLGGVLYFLLTGIRPRWDEDQPASLTVDDVVFGTLSGEFSLAPLSEELPQDLVSLTVRALAPEPDQRFGSWRPATAAAEFADALDAMMTGWSRSVATLRVGPHLLVDGPADWERQYYAPADASAATERGMGDEEGARTQPWGFADPDPGYADPEAAATEPWEQRDRFDPFDEFDFDGPPSAAPEDVDDVEDPTEPMSTANRSDL